MNSLANRYNQLLIISLIFAPFIAYFTLSVLEMDFRTVIQLFSYIGIILLLIFKPKGTAIKIPNYLIFYFFFILYEFYSAFIQLDREFKVIYLFSNTAIGGFNMMLIIENIYIKKKFYKFLIKASKYILIIAVIVILIQQLVDPSFFANPNLDVSVNVISNTVNSSKDRLGSIYSWLGFMAIGFSFVPIFILIVEDLYNKKKKILIWVIMGLLFTVLSKARWVMLNGLLVLVILFINQKNKGKQIAKLIFVFPLVLLSTYLVLTSVGVDAKSIVEDRILEKDKGMGEKTAGTRILAFVAFNKLYWDNAVFGIGNIKYGMGGTDRQDYKLRSILNGRSSQLHVGYLSVLYMYGIVGAFFFNGFLYLLLRKLYKNAKRTRIWAPFLGILGLAIANLTLVTFSVYQMGLIIVLVADRYYNQNRNPRKKLIHD